jgi:hypothetical protein
MSPSTALTCRTVWEQSSLIGDVARCGEDRISSTITARSTGLILPRSALTLPLAVESGVACLVTRVQRPAPVATLRFVPRDRRLPRSSAYKKLISILT